MKPRVVFTNGCFDIIHRGHISYLNEARSKGGYLIVGLNSDSSVKKIKGNSRPINNQNDRKYVLENLKSVNEVIIFDEETPYELIKRIQPDVLVKGGDWTTQDIIGSDLVLARGGKVESLFFVDNYSTTQMINKISQVFNG